MRRKDREVTDLREILRIINKAKILHLGLFDGDHPYVVPLHFGYEYANGSLVFYMHSAREGHKLDLIRACPAVCVELECDIELIPGGDVPCRYGSSFASVIGRGRAEILADSQEKSRALALLMKNQTGREFDIDASMASAVEVIKVTVPDFTAKSRPKEP
ncbi:MAG: pyridoxamine 5'-phosphate oxidase family protein [Oscillospiraceae bacterium]|nr:pyridoxamine 5'-phosphate oxidase family protein [Oscillospiraceae bacterium]